MKKVKKRIKAAVALLLCAALTFSFGSYVYAEEGEEMVQEIDEVTLNKAKVAVVCQQLGFEKHTNVCIAVMMAESGGHSDARNGNCIGPFQINSKIWGDVAKKQGADIETTDGNIAFGVTMLKGKYETYWDWTPALNSYNGRKDVKNPSKYSEKVLKMAQNY